MNACTEKSLILLWCLPSIEMEIFHQGKCEMRESPQSSAYGFTQGST